MPKFERHTHRVVETGQEARQGEKGPSVLVALIIGVALVVVGFAVVWFGFFGSG